MASPNILFITANHPSEPPSWIQAIENYLHSPISVLRDRGAKVALQTFQDPALTPANLSTYTHIIFLAADKYNQHITPFNHFLTATLPSAQRLNPALKAHNPASLVHWNTNKTYLAELAAAGFLVPRTTFLPPSTPAPALQTHLQSTVPPATPVVLKPSISASGHSTHLLPAPHALRAADVSALAALAAAAPPGASLMLQEFLPAIRSGEHDAGFGGEWSMVLIAGVLTHAVRKRPRDGEFRINSAFKGIWVPMEPEDERVPRVAVEAAGRVWEWLVRKERELAGVEGKESELLYARVDGVVGDDGRFVLMEVELIEPYLWLLEEGPGRKGLLAFFDAVVGPKGDTVDA